MHPESCYSFDGKINYVGDSNSRHFYGGLAKYKKHLVTYGHDKAMLENLQKFFNQNENAGHRRDNPKSSSLHQSEIMKMTKNGTFIWSDVEGIIGTPSIDVDSRGIIRPMNFYAHSLVNVPSDINEEYVLLLGGVVEINQKRVGMQQAVLKFNGSWSFFGNLNKPRATHNAIYWNGAVYVFGGVHVRGVDDDGDRTKMEIWKIEESPDEFKTSENWPELDKWYYPHVFIVPV